MRPAAAGAEATAAELIPKRSGCVLYVDHVEEHGISLFDLVQAADLDGVVAKPISSPYVQRRKPLRVKVKNPTSSQKAGRHEMFVGFRQR